MKFFEKTFVKSKDVVKAAGKKAENMIETGKIKMSIADLKGENEELFRQIGEMVYCAYENEGEVADFSEKCGKILENKKKIDELQKKADAFMNVITCDNCGEANPDKNAFCSKCGAKLDRPEPVADTADEAEADAAAPEQEPEGAAEPEEAHDGQAEL